MFQKKPGMQEQEIENNCGQPLGGVRSQLFLGDSTTCRLASLSYFKSFSECAFKTRRRCLHSFESRKVTGESSVNGAIASRRYAASAAARRPASPQPQSEYLDDEEFNGGGSRSGYGRSRSDEGRPASVLYPKARPKANPEPLIEHLHRLFPPLEFPSTVASQMLTHISAQEAWAGHNGRLSFVGRRVLHSYLLLFLHSASLQLSKASPSSFNPNTVFDFDLIAYRALHTALLGEHVGA
ncbi:hypothetical protein DFH11DRAFT_1253134 [Phellopilus nigrolimitatus]|nr:hypothetical protein DFH11DRAFT_1253134 [Phellopilus nigrolimitatus]